jgi:quinolinate synthase
MNTQTARHHHLSAQELFTMLKQIRVGGQACTYSLRKCEELVPLINQIRDLKEKENAVILVHSYVVPEILYGVGDFSGDSYQLSKNATETDAQTIVFAGVRFMGETAKILNPDKKVLIPALNDGCSLAESITAKEVKDLRDQFPDHTFICYINTSAEVKADCDVCVTSANVYKVCEKIPNDKIYFLPDKFMGQNLVNHFQEKGIEKTIRYYHGTCYVHEEYTPDQIFMIRQEYPEVKIVSHPECSTEVIKNSDYVGSTSQMLDFMEHSSSREFLMLTECGLSSRLQKEYPDKRFVGSCTMCRYMKSNRLEDIIRVLTKPLERDVINIDEAVRLRALRCVEAMFHYTQS